MTNQNPKSKSHNSKAFTLIELLVVVLVIGILSAVVLRIINPNILQSKSRDSRRIADLEKIRVALETYFTDTREYPDDGGASNMGVLVPNYIRVIPNDPTPSNSYYYVSTGRAWTDQGAFILAADLENPVDPADTEHLCDNQTVTDSGFVAANCYMVTSPSL